MATSVLPSLIDALVARATAALPAVDVYDGFATVNNPGDFLMIGVDDPDNPNEAQSASSQQAWANANNTARDESGEVTCAALSWNGDGDPKAARTAAFTTCAALETTLRTDPTLGGVAGLLWTSYGTSTSLSQDQTDSAAQALIVFSIYFRARI